ncbi:hypothetical protein PFISCL1PPCAC_28577, partial [Pristionchus fissidentatus]
PMSRTKFAVGHLPSPYLRRYRLPPLSSRPFDDPISPEDEDGKMAIIISKMELLSRQPSTSGNNNHAETAVGQRIEKASIDNPEEEDEEDYRPPLPPHGVMRRRIESEKERGRNEDNRGKKKKKKRK